MQFIAMLGPNVKYIKVNAQIFCDSFFLNLKFMEPTPESWPLTLGHSLSQVLNSAVMLSCEHLKCFICFVLFHFVPLSFGDLR